MAAAERHRGEGKLLYHFDNYVLDTERRELRAAHGAIAVQPQVFDLLAYLIRNRERVVSKDDLIAGIWGGRVVSESALTTRINAARVAIGDSGAEQRLIKTLPRKGVRFMATVREQHASDNDATAASAQILPLPDKPSIAVLPFENMSADPEQTYFADGIVEEIITALSRFRQLFVIARNSSFTYKGRSVDVKQVGRELGVRYVLEGSVRKAAARVRITAQLVDAASGAHLWADRYDRSIDDIFAVQDEITSAITAAIEPEIGASERERARGKAPGQMGAWELYARGMWHLLRHNSQDSLEAQRIFHSAIALDPDFAAPHAALAIVHFFQIARATTNDQDSLLDAMVEHAGRAIELDPKDSLGHSALGLTLMERGEFDRSAAEHEAALASNPNSPFGHFSYGYLLNRMDRFAAALERFDAALRLNPRDPANWSHLTLKAGTLYLLERYEEAAAAARDAARSQTVDIVWPHIHWAAALGQLGRAQEAGAAVAELLRLRPGLTLSAFAAWSTNKRRSKRALDHLVAGLRKSGMPE